MKTKKKPNHQILRKYTQLVAGLICLLGVHPALATCGNPLLTGNPSSADTVRIIHMKNGQTEYALDTRKSGDTLFYRLVMEPSVARGILYREVTGITDTVIDSFRDLMNRDFSDMLEMKISHYQGKIAGGTVMMCLGGLAIIGGVVIISNNSGGSLSEGMATFGGALLTIAGAGLTIPGIIITANSASKANTFKEQINRMSLGIGYDTRQAFVSLQYRIP